MYGTLAEFYDIFFEDSLYDEAAAFLSGLLKGRLRGADFGCGTGRLTVRLIKNYGCEIYGVDLSPVMLNRAKENAYNSSVRADFILGDIQTFMFLRKNQFVLAFNDVINYIKNPSKAFCNVYNSLEDDGLFIFDISSEYKLKYILSGQTYSEEKGDITYIWSNFLNKKNNSIDMELTFFKKRGGLYERSEEIKCQYIHKTADIVNELKYAGFKDIVTLSGYKNEPLQKNSERVTFIARKIL